MLETEKHAFRELLAACMAMYGKPVPEKTVIRMWWGLLEAHPFESVARAFSTYAATEKYPPVPAAILSVLGAFEPNPWPSADEAWTLALSAADEATTVVWCDEVAQAKAVADPALQIGDKYGARLAFVSAYDRLVAEAKRVGKAPVWAATLGDDKGERERVIRDAVALGKLSPSALDALPAPDLLALPGPTADRGRSRARFAELRALLAGVGPHVDNGEKRREFERHKAAEVNRILGGKH